MPRNHIVISGTGRAGTSFLVQLLTHLGLDTGFAADHMPLYEVARAGLELDIRSPDAPYVVKSPWFCDYADEVLSDSSIQIDHLFVPMRDLFAAAESRRNVSAASVQQGEHPLNGVPGGLWHTTDKSQQEEILLRQLYKLLLAAASSEFPVTLIRFPRLVRDSEYLYRKLFPVLGQMSQSEFESVFHRVADPALVHSFGVGDR